MMNKLCNQHIINSEEIPTIFNSNQNDLIDTCRLLNLTKIYDDKIKKEQSNEINELKRKYEEALEKEKQQKKELDEILAKKEAKRQCLNKTNKYYDKIKRDFANIKHYESILSNLVRQNAEKQLIIDQLTRDVISSKNENAKNEQQIEQTNNHIKFLIDNSNKLNENLKNLINDKYSNGSLLENLKQNYAQLVTNKNIKSIEYQQTINHLEDKLEEKREKIKKLKKKLKKLKKKSSSHSKNLTKKVSSSDSSRPCSPISNGVWIDDDDFGWGGGYY